MLKIPRHIAIIMDGNGRWAKQNGYPRTQGHKAGAGRVREIVEKCLELGVEYLTVYAFSKENWKRPRGEVNAILRLSQLFFKKEFGPLKEKGVFFVHLGEKEGLPRYVVRIIENMVRNNTRDRKLQLNIALNYGSRSEITSACRSLMERAARGQLEPSALTEETLGAALYTAGIPDPDLLIRTGGEVRVSNFLLWQIAYTELYISDMLWPDFTAVHLLGAIEEYSKRSRRFGGL
jgi:undecaprenyl diphosphate synthase